MIPWYLKNDTLKKVFFYENSCCSPELFYLFSSRYDPERLGFVRTEDINKADILLLNGLFTEGFSSFIMEKYKALKYKPVVVAVGGCSINGGPLNSKLINVPVSVYIPGCPPRPESIIDGLLKGLKAK